MSQLFYDFYSTNVLKVTPDNGFPKIIYSLLMGRQTIFRPTVSPKFVQKFENPNDFMAKINFE